jgi:hypothetical protein
MIYVKVENDVVVNRAVFDDSLPPDWPEPEKWFANEEAQIGWTYDGTTFRAPKVSGPPFEPKLDMGGDINDVIGR